MRPTNLADGQVGEDGAGEPRVHGRCRGVVHADVVAFHLGLARDGEAPHRAAQYEVLVDGGAEVPVAAAYLKAAASGRVGAGIELQGGRG